MALAQHNDISPSVEHYILPQQQQKTAQEEPKECGKELKVSIWPQNAPHPNLTELLGAR